MSISRLTLWAVLSVAVLLVAACATPYQWTSYPAEQWKADFAHLRNELLQRNPHYGENSRDPGTILSA
jgi:uncharacterized protein involved in cysteine biosynthesis